MNNSMRYLPLFPTRWSEYISLIIGVIITGIYAAANFLDGGYYNHKEVADLFRYLFPNTLSWTLGLRDTNYVLLWVVAYPVFLWIGRYLAYRHTGRDILKVTSMYLVISIGTVLIDTYAWKLALP
jgi:hypothetical protein